MGDFWFLAGLGCAFVGYGAMKLLLAYAQNVDLKTQAGVLEKLKADLEKHKV